MAGEVVNTVYGPISADFAKSPLGDLCVPEGGVQTGPFGSQLHASDYVEHGTPIITVEHLGENRIIHANLPRVTDEDKERLSRYTLQTGDIVFSRVGSVDRRAIVHPEEHGWLFSGRCLRVRPEQEKIDPSYLSWFFGLPAFREYIRQIAVGATMPSLNTKILCDVAIYYPQSPKEQQAIACILGALDDKIELNRRMNRTLEGMARAIFKSWFVDFDPVRAKAAGQQPSGLKPDLAALFPDAFEDSELGEIPKGRGVKSLDEMAVVLDCLHSRKPARQDEGRLLIQVFNVGNTGRLDFSDPYYISPDDYAVWIRRMEVRPGDLVITKTGRVGAVGQMPCGYSAAMGRNMVGIRPIPGISTPRFLKDCLLSDQMRCEMTSNTNDGTILRSLHVKAINKLRNVLPRFEVVHAYDVLVNPIHAKLETNDAEVRTISTIRDTLLPKLIAGELRVKNAERIAGRCA